jgi:hypothetical protein
MSTDCNTEPSLIEYARFHGLADNHLDQDVYGCFPSESLLCAEDERLPDLALPWDGKLPAEPKFQLNSKAASLLASSLRPQPPPDWSHTLSDHHRVRDMKMEQPALRTDHENDMKKMRRPRLSKIRALDLVPIEVSEGENEDFAWSSNPTKVTTQWDKKLREEKLQTTREVLKALQDTLRPVYTSEMHETIIREDLAYKRVGQEFNPKESTLTLNSVRD